ncbi:Hypothetical predicted protein [Drosophila guanche]|uniref:DUF4794 domain-containing protein n=1 Tax=Drosophila guanche TaxID=7266 RepID=A0A3B0IZT5_DROGU|nr:Hypothetical predicted protein [Drosophila guanche]
MLLLGNAFLWLMFAGSDWFALLSNGKEVQVRLPVWSVGNVVSHFSNYVNKNKKNGEKDRTPPYPYPYPPPHYHYPPYPYPWPNPKTTTPPPTTTTPPPTTKAPTTFPTTTARGIDYTLCEKFPHLPICQEFKSAQLEENDNSIPTVLSESAELGTKQQLQQLTITSEAHSVSSLCYHYAQLCRKPEEAQFVRLTDEQGKPLLLIYPAEAEYPLALGKSFSVMSKPTRRPSWQRNLPE